MCTNRLGSWGRGKGSVKEKYASAQQQGSPDGASWDGTGAWKRGSEVLALL